jgi:hypothetical protein
MDHAALALAIRWLHVVAMAVALGGAALLAWLSWREPAARVVPLALRYEQLFWAAAGILVLSGVGNLGAFGVALPAPGTDWGRTFVTKLGLVALLAALSLPRSLAVLRLAGQAGARDGTLRLLYGGTLALLAVIVGLAERLAPG